MPPSISDWTVIGADPLAPPTEPEDPPASTEAPSTSSLTHGSDTGDTGGVLGTDTETTGTVYSDLVLYLPMESADVVGTTVLDRSTTGWGALDGTLENGGPTFGLPGMVGEAAEFPGGANNGNHPYIDFSVHTPLLGTLGEGTIVAWVQTPSADLVSDALTIFAASDASDTSSELRYWVANGGGFGFGTLACGVRGAGAYDGTTTSDIDPLLDGAWHHVAAVHSLWDTTTRVYIDGVLHGSAKSGFLNRISDLDTAGIGRNKDNTSGGGQWFFDGQMDEFSLWSRPLSDAEIEALYLDGLAGIPLLP